METGADFDTHQVLLNKLSKLEEQINSLTDELQNKQLSNFDLQRKIEDQHQQIAVLEAQLNSNLSPLFLRSYRQINGQLALIPKHIDWHKMSEILVPLERLLTAAKLQLIHLKGVFNSSVMMPMIYELKRFLFSVSRYLDEIKRYVPNWIKDPLEQMVDKYAEQVKTAYEKSLQFIEARLIRPLMELIDIALFHCQEFYALAKETAIETQKNLLEKTRALTRDRDDSSKEGGTISRQPLTHLHA